MTFAKRVRDKYYTKTHLYAIMGLFRPLLKKGRVSFSEADKFACACEGDV